VLSLVCFLGRIHEFLIVLLARSAKARHIRPKGQTCSALLVCLALETVNYSLIFHRTLTTCFLASLSCLVLTRVLYSFLKAMARGDEHRSKNH
jgi:hypothetical protein